MVVVVVDVELDVDVEVDVDVVVLEVLVPPVKYAWSIQLVEPRTVAIPIGEVMSVAKLALPLRQAPALNDFIGLVSQWTRDKPSLLTQCCCTRRNKCCRC